jgi:hypothetical protein
LVARELLVKTGGGRIKRRDATISKWENSKPAQSAVNEPAKKVGAFGSTVQEKLSHPSVNAGACAGKELL